MASLQRGKSKKKPTKTTDQIAKEKEEERLRRAKAKRSPESIEAELIEVFNKFDKDGNGTVSVDELYKMLQVLGQSPTKAEVTTLINEFDDNHNGQLDLNEFKSLIMPCLKDDDTKEQELRDAFAIFDKDDSGFIDKMELAKVLRLTGEKLSEADIDEMFTKMDTNGDGEINYEEFAAAIKNGSLFDDCE